MVSRSSSPWPGRLGFLALSLFLAGCSDTVKPQAPAPIPEPMPYPSTPVRALRAFEWCWDHRDFNRYAELFSDDFLGACAGTDSAGNAFRGRALSRLDEFASIRHLFIGGGTYPPADIISLQLDANLIPQPDSRPGREDMTYYQEIATRFVLRIETRRESFQVTGMARFWFVRGDVAVIPPELVARGFRPDIGRWYISRWEDESSAGFGPGSGTVAGMLSMPAVSTTWCAIKAHYQ